MASKLEHLKSFISEVIDRFHEGSLNAAEAKATIWQQLQIVGVKPTSLRGVAWLRIAGAPAQFPQVIERAGCFGKILTAFEIGPRADETPAVLYLTVRTGTARRAGILVEALRRDGVSVRDWRFGC